MVSTAFGSGRGRHPDNEWAKAGARAFRWFRDERSNDAGALFDAALDCLAAPTDALALRDSAVGQNLSLHFRLQFLSPFKRVMRRASVVEARKAVGAHG